MLSRDLNELLVSMRDREPLEIAMRIGNSATPERLAFVPENINGQTLVLWSERIAPNLQRDYVAQAQPPYYRVDEQTESVLELSLSALTMWEGRQALTQGRIYGVFANKNAELEKSYERIVRYIRRHWRKNPVAWMSGYVGPAAKDWFEGGGLLLPTIFLPSAAIGFNFWGNSTRIDGKIARAETSAPKAPTPSISKRGQEHHVL